jgi:hypothetical protein
MIDQIGYILNMIGAFIVNNAIVLVVLSLWFISQGLTNINDTLEDIAKALRQRNY